MEGIIEAIKLLTVFFGFGFISLMIYYFFSDSTNIFKVLKRKLDFFKQMDKVSVNKKTSVSPNSAFYEISYGEDKKVITIFSSHGGIKIIN